jgi:hypothetical protein
MLAGVGLFGNKAEKQAKAAAADTEAARLAALPIAALAAESMVAFGPNGMGGRLGHRQGPVEVASWLLADAPARYRGPILRPVMEALGVLEHANLLTRHSFGSAGQASTYRITSLGETALADGTVRRQLGIETH